MVVVSNKKRGRVLLAYLLIGWGLPLAICIVTIGLNFSGRGLVLYGVTSDGRVGICWINHFVSLVVSFVLPLCISQSINLLLLVLVTVFLCHSVRNKSTQHKTDYLRLMRVWLAAFSTTGLTWIFGFLALVDPTSSLWYPFIIFNSTQGFSIFLAFLCTKKVFKLYLGLLKREKSLPRDLRRSRVTREVLPQDVPSSVQAGGRQPASLELHGLGMTEERYVLASAGSAQIAVVDTREMQSQSQPSSVRAGGRPPASLELQDLGITEERYVLASAVSAQNRSLASS